MREESFWCTKPRYSEVRVIARRVIARYDCILFKDNQKGIDDHKTAIHSYVFEVTEFIIMF